VPNEITDAVAGSLLSIYALHTEEPWNALDASLPGVLAKYLQIEPRSNQTVSLLSIPSGICLPRHRHAGPVCVYTVLGRWQYLEHDWIAEQGSFVQEAAGSCHTPEVFDHHGYTAITLNWVCGDLEIMSRSGKVVGLENADTACWRRANSPYCVGSLIPRTLDASLGRHHIDGSLTHWAE